MTHEARTRLWLQSHPRLKNGLRPFARTYYRLRGLARQWLPGQARRADGPVRGRIQAEAFHAEIEAWRRREPGHAAYDGYITMHFPRLLDAMNLADAVLPPGGSVLDYSAVPFFTQSLQALVKPGRLTNVTGVNFELDDYVDRFGAGSHDLCLNTEVLEHLLFNPSRMVHSINRLLRPGGHLILSTPNAIATGNAIRLITGNPPSLWNQLNATTPHYFDRHNRDWMPFEVMRRLQEHGFEVVQLITRDNYADTQKLLQQHSALVRTVQQFSTHEFHGDTQVIVARKLRESAEPVRNAWLYMLPTSPAKAA